METTSKITLYFDITEIKSCENRTQSLLHKFIYEYSKSHRYIEREVNGIRKRILQVRFDNEKNEEIFLKWIGTTSIKSIEPGTLSIVTAKKDQVLIVKDKDSIRITENYISLGVWSDSVFKNTEEFVYSIVEQSDLILLKRVCTTDLDVVTLDTFDSAITEYIDKRIKEGPKA